jgi:hypothetical protein
MNAILISTMRTRPEVSCCSRRRPHNNLPRPPYVLLAVGPCGVASVRLRASRGGNVVIVGNRRVRS